MPPYGRTERTDSLSPREHMLMDNENANLDKQLTHQLRMKQLEIEAKKLELKLRAEESTKSRKHSQQMKELELAIRQSELKWQQILRLPTILLKLPVLCLFGIAYCISCVKGNEINSREFWSFLR
jgi:hypothetical protein